MTDQLRLVCATRLSREGFWQDTLLGQSLSLFPDALLPELAIEFDNDAPCAEGLSSFYNRVISNTADGTNLLFVHDDVFIHDVFVKARLQEAFRRFDIVGLAGSRRSSLEEPSWGLRFDPDTLEPIGWQPPPIHLSGAVAHPVGSPKTPPTAGPPEYLMGIYGTVPDFCTLLDGLFIGVHTRKLARTSVRFDERFKFHHYDLDFCRQATDAGLFLGTWPIFVTHGSGGNFMSDDFKRSARLYLDKWQRDERPTAPPPAPVAMTEAI